MLKINELSRLYLGVKGENESRTIEIDMSAWAQIYPNATAVILHKRNGDQAKELTGATYDSATHVLSWTTSSYDTFYDGFGVAEVRMVESDVVKKTKDAITTVTASSITNGSGNITESNYQAFLNAVIGNKTDAQAAQTAAEAAQEAAEDAAAAAEAAVENGPYIDETTGNWFVYDWDDDEYKNTGVHAQGPAGADGSNGQDGQDGADGFSPTASVTKSGKVATITITDKNGTTTETVSDGEDADPQDLIDDTAGEGDTDVTFSADKLTSDFSDVLNAINGKYTKPNDGIPASDIASGVIPDVSGLYTKPAGGIPSTDLADSYIEEPASEGTSGQFLCTDGNGGRTWATPSGGGGTSDYTDLTNKPQIAGTTLSGNKSLSDLGIASASDCNNIKTNPYSLGMQADYGYIDAASPFALTRSATKSRVIFAWLPCGKGTVISTNLSAITSFCVYRYNMITGEYIEKVGVVTTNTTPITIESDSVILIYGATTYDDCSSYFDTLNTAVYIKYAEPSVGLVPYQVPMEYGSIEGSNGEPSGSSNTRIRSSDYLLVGKGTKIYLPSTRAKLNVFWYGMDESSGYIDRSGEQKNPVYVVPQDMKIKLVFVPWAGSSFSSVNEVPVKMLVIAPLEEHLPEYYTSESHIQTKRDTAVAHYDTCAYNGLNFYFLTDTHWASNIKRTPLILRYLKQTTGISDLIFNGDAITSYSTKAKAIIEYGNFRKAFSDFEGIHWMPVIGNHELNNPGATAGNTAQLTANEAYGVVIKENERLITRIDQYSYYIDFTTVKVRVIFVGSDYQSLIPSATQTAVVSAINSLPSGYKVLVCSHIALTGHESTGEIETSFQSIATALDGIHGSVIAVLSGHRHADGKITTAAGVNIIATTCDAQLENGGLTRTHGTTGEQAFDIVQIDLTNNKIYLTRVGAGSNRTYDICQ